MSKWNEAAHWAFGHGFWYTDPVSEVKGLSDEQLFWTPTPQSLCALWQVGHIAHRERLHIGHLLQGRDVNELFPNEFHIFGADWSPPQTVRNQIQSPFAVFDWMHKVRQASHDYISSLTDADFHSIPPSSIEHTSVAQVLFQTVAHTALHIGRIQMLRAMIEKNNERPC
jgi:hypothetical protein